MDHTNRTIVLAAFASMLIVSLGLPAPAAAGCGELCHPSGECRETPTHPEWGCNSWGTFCYDDSCWGLTLQPDQVEQIAAAAEAGDLELASQLASRHPNLRIFKAGVMLFNGPQLAGIAGPEVTWDTVRVACTGPAAAEKTEPSAEPAAEEVAATDRK